MSRFIPHRLPLRLALLAFVAVVSLVVAACGSAGGNATGSVSAPSVTVDPFAGPPAPAAGNGGATDVGVTATSIDIASIYAGSGVLPGAQQGAYRGAKAYVDYVNAGGGIFGRKLNLKELDTGFDAGQGQAICAANIPTQFAFTAPFTNVDSACLPQLKASGIPWIGQWFSPDYADLPNAMSPFPSAPYSGTDTACRLVKQAYPQAKTVAILWVNVAGIEPLVAAEQACWKSVGIDTVYSAGTDAQSPNLTSYVVNARSKGADIVDAFAQEITGAARIAQAIKAQNWKPMAAIDYAVYAEKWKTLAGAAGEGWLAAPPLGQGAYLDPQWVTTTQLGKVFEAWFPKSNPGAALDVFALAGFESTAYAVAGMVKAGPQLTRSKLLAALNGITDYDNGGLTAKATFVKPGKVLENCNILMQATADGYKQLQPATTGQFYCGGQLITS